MSAEVKKEVQLEIAHVLFIDTVGYSRLSSNQQRAVVDELNEVVRSSDQYRRAEAAGRLIKIPTGDGMALVFYSSPEAPAQCAIEISGALKEHPRLQLRMGVHSGPVSGVIDVNGHANLAGAGLNMAPAGDGLRGRRAHSPFQACRRGSRRIRTVAPLLHDLGACEMKHGTRVSIVNLYADQVGNRQLPKKFQALKAAAVSTRLPMRFSTFTFLLALCCGLTNGCSEGVTRRTAATVLSVKGDVVFRMAAENNFQPISRESRIYDGSIVRTSDGALLNLGLIAAVLAQVSSNSEIKIEELKIAKDGNQTGGSMRSRSARIRLNRGKIIVLFSVRDKSTSQFAISTPAVTVTADSDCLFRVQRDDTTTRLTCVQGKVYASTGAQPPIAIGAGYFQQWPSTRPEPVAATEDAVAQIDITDSLEIENQLRELGAGWQNRRPF